MIGAPTPQVGEIEALPDVTRLRTLSRGALGVTAVPGRRRLPRKRAAGFDRGDDRVRGKTRPRRSGGDTWRSCSASWPSFSVRIMFSSVAVIRCVRSSCQFLSWATFSSNARSLRASSVDGSVRRPGVDPLPRSSRNQGVIRSRGQCGGFGQRREVPEPTRNRLRRDRRALR